MTTPLGPYGLVPYDLQAPMSLLMPGGMHDRVHRRREVALGNEADGALLEIVEWDSCRPSCNARGSHKSGHRLTLRVPCDSMPHCHSCECGDGHSIYLTGEQETALKGAIL